MIQLDPIMDFTARYQTLTNTALQITLHLRPGSRLAGYDELLLDNLLARAVVDLATAGAGLPNTPDAYDIPLPLACLWRSAEGYPLWAATPFLPAGIQARDVAYCHKRAQTGHWTRTASGRFNIAPTDGRWMERRVPLPTTVAQSWHASCLSHADTIAELLSTLSFVGKRRASGFGEVERWEILPGQFNLIADGSLTRSIPEAASILLSGHHPSEPPTPVGWTPPQWKPSLWCLGWRIGTSCRATA
jgi:hypothetical protein